VASFGFRIRIAKDSETGVKKATKGEAKIPSAIGNIQKSSGIDIIGFLFHDTDVVGFGRFSYQR